MTGERSGYLLFGLTASYAYYELICRGIYRPRFAANLWCCGARARFGRRQSIRAACMDRRRPFLLHVFNALVV